MLLPLGKLASIQSAHLPMAATHCVFSVGVRRPFRIAYALASEISWSALVPSHPVAAGHSSIHKPDAAWMLISQLPRRTAASAYFASWEYLNATANGYTASAAREWTGFGRGLV